MSQAHNPNAIGCVVPIWAGSGSGAGPGAPARIVILPFVQADLVGGVFTGVHNLAQAFVLSRVYNNLNQEIQPDNNDIVDANTLAVDLQSFEPIAGIWRLVVVG